MRGAHFNTPFCIFTCSLLRLYPIHNNGLLAPEEYFRHHAEENNFDLVGIYADEGITGIKKKNRKEFLRMLECMFNSAEQILSVDTVTIEMQMIEKIVVYHDGNVEVALKKIDRK